MNSSPTCDYEAERAKRIAENMRRLAELGVKETAAVVHAAIAPARRKPRAPRSPKPRFKNPDGGAPPRRSGRIDGLPARCYSVDLDANRELRKLAGPKRPKSGRSIRERVTSADEVYTQAHVDSLGTHSQPWELFVDGYDPQSGRRIYDAVGGSTCHQCRQKTLGTHTSCDACGRLSGIFCGDCLFMRYGENVLEANAASERARAARAASGSGTAAAADERGWVCPPCRGLCNCSFHRARRGWAPTGSMYRYAVAEGYASVAHYLVLNNLADGVVVPPGLKQGMAAASSRPASAAAPGVVPDGPVTTTEARGGKPRSKRDKSGSSSPRGPGSPAPASAKGRGSAAARRRSLSSPLPAELASPALEPAPVLAATPPRKRTGSFMRQIRINLEGFQGRGRAKKKSGGKRTTAKRSTSTAAKAKAATSVRGGRVAKKKAAATNKATAAPAPRVTRRRAAAVA